MSTKKFIINITTTGYRHSLRSFEVPEEVLKDKRLGGELQAAGWWYMNRIDSFSCTGPYQWTVMPYDQVAAFFNSPKDSDKKSSWEEC